MCGCSWREVRQGGEHEHRPTPSMGSLLLWCPERRDTRYKQGQHSMPWVVPVWVDPCSNSMWQAGPRTGQGVNLPTFKLALSGNFVSHRGGQAPVLSWGLFVTWPMISGVNTAGMTQGIWEAKTCGTHAWAVSSTRKFRTFKSFNQKYKPWQFQFIKDWGWT